MSSPKTRAGTSANDAAKELMLAVLAFAAAATVTIGLLVIASADDATIGGSSVEHGAVFCPECHDE